MIRVLKTLLVKFLKDESGGIAVQPQGNSILALTPPHPPLSSQSLACPCVGRGG